MVSRTGITLTPRVGSAVPQHHADVKSRPHLSADLSSPILQLPKEVPTTASRSYRGSAAGVIHGPCSTRSAFDTRAGESAKSAASPAGVWGRGHCAKQELVDHPRHICRALRHGEMVRRGKHREPRVGEQVLHLRGMLDTRPERDRQRPTDCGSGAGSSGRVPAGAARRDRGSGATEPRRRGESRP